MKTPEKIKRGLEACIGGGCDSKRTQCPYRKENDCTTAVVMDAFAYIQHLEAELEQLESKLSMLLWHVTGGRFSKTSYTINEMKSFADDYWQHVCDECEREEGANDENA